VFPRGPFPGSGGVADQLGIELRVLQPVVSYLPAPQTGSYAEVDFTGAGIVNVGSWIEAILQLWVQCRNHNHRITECHGLHYVAAPYVRLIAISSQPGFPMAKPTAFNYITNGETAFLFQNDGWYYQSMVGAFTDVERPMFGPFSTPEEAAREAVVRLQPRGTIPPGQMPPGGEHFDRLVEAFNFEVVTTRTREP
jgi:hypothetical protein